MPKKSANMKRVEAIALDLPEAIRHDIEAWGGEPTFRVRGKNFVFSSQDATYLSVKLPKEEAIAVVESDPVVDPTGYGLGRHGWISFPLPEDASEERWEEVIEWIETSYTLVAPKTLAREVLARLEADAGD